MNKLRRLVLVAMLAGSTLPLGASCATPPINNPDVGSYWILGASGQVVPATEVPGAQAQRVVVSTVGGIWEDSAHSGLDAPLKKGDQLLVTVWLKAETAQGGTGHVNIKLEENDAPYNAVGQREVAPNATWAPYTYTATVKQNYPAGAVSLVLQYGDKPQTLLIGPMTVTKSGDSQPN